MEIIHSHISNLSLSLSVSAVEGAISNLTVDDLAMKAAVAFNK